MNPNRFIISSFLLLALLNSLWVDTLFATNTVTAAANLASPTLLHNIKQIDAGGFHTCALTDDGKVKCWGRNDFGQLGDGTFIASNIPVNVVDFDSQVVAISVGSLHSCALTDLGAVKCWGQNYDGQLGNGSTDVSNIPVDVVELKSKVTTVSAGSLHTCAVLIDSTVKCWGANYSDQLGNFKTGNNSPTPVEVLNMNQPLNRVIAVTTGVSHTCVVTKSGGVQCWGDNTNGQLGTNDTYSSNRPLGVYGLEKDVVAISAGNFHTCVLLNTGAIQCWGDNSLSQLGTDIIDHGLVPVDVISLEKEATALSSGGGHSCIVTTAESVKCWGSNSAGQLGNDNIVNSDTPVSISLVDDEVTAVTAGEAHTCILTKAGAVKCWGRNESGQLGNGHSANSIVPNIVPKLRRDILGLSSGSTHTCVVTSTGEAICWGHNNFGQLGDGSTNNRQIPTPVIDLGIGVVAVSAGDAHTCALTDEGGVKCWGKNNFGQLGDGSDIESSNRPVNVRGLDKDVVAISAGYGHSCALLNNGHVKCWGWNKAGQLGNKTKDAISKTPVDVIGVDEVNAIGAGAGHTCALTIRGEVKCWGSNIYGQLGNNNTGKGSSPITVNGLDPGVSALSVGSFHTCVITIRRAVKCWGANSFGELGNSDASGISAFPVDVGGLGSEVAAISSGQFYTCIVTKRGGVSCWGREISEEQSQDRRIEHNTPVTIRGLGSRVTLVSVGGSHICALTNSGVKCIGNNMFGQLGDGKSWYTVPVDVVDF